MGVQVKKLDHLANGKDFEDFATCLMQKRERQKWGGGGGWEGGGRAAGEWV